MKTVLRIQDRRLYQKGGWRMPTPSQLNFRPTRRSDSLTALLQWQKRHREGVGLPTRESSAIRAETTPQNLQGRVPLRSGQLLDAKFGQG